MNRARTLPTLPRIRPAVATPMALLALLVLLVPAISFASPLTASITGCFHVKTTSVSATTYDVQCTGSLAGGSGQYEVSWTAPGGPTYTQILLGSPPLTFTSPVLTCPLAGGTVQLDVLDLSSGSLTPVTATAPC